MLFDIAVFFIYLVIADIIIIITANEINPITIVLNCLSDNELFDSAVVFVII